MKRILLTLMLIILICASIPMMGRAAISGTGGSCGDSVDWWLYDDGTLEIYGTGDMIDYSRGQAPWGNAVKNVIIHEGVTSIGSGSFYMTRTLQSVSIPNSVTRIGSFAFQYCYNLANVTLPASLTELGMCAFYSCTSITGVTIPENLKTYEYGAFGGCTSLTGISVDPQNSSFCSLNGVLFNKAKTELIQYPAGLIGAYTVPNGVTSIFYWAFAECYENLTGVTIPNSLTSIGDNAFGWCYGLMSVTLPESVSYIGPCAFYWCKNLSKVTVLNREAEFVGLKVFDGCSSNLAIYCYEGSTAQTYAGSKAVLLAEKPVITTQPKNKTVNEGAKATFKVAATGAGTYQWYYRKNSTSDWTAIKNGTSASYSLTTAAKHNGYQFRCRVKNSAGHVYSNTVKLTVNLKPVITTQPKNKTVNEGAKATFKVVATGAESYQWYYRKNSTSDWTAIKKATSASYSLATAAKHNGYQFRCMVKNSAGHVYSNTVKLTVNLKPVITAQPKNKTVNEGEKATFKVAATGATEYQWYYLKPGQSTWNAVSKNGLSASYTLTAAAKHNGYKFKCEVKNAVGNVYTNVVTLTVK